MTSIAALAALVVFSCASFFFALAETSLFSLSKWQLRQLNTNHPRAGASIERLLAEPQNLLALLVFGNTFANAGIVGVTLWMAMSHGWPLIAILPILLGGILLGAEVAPKTLAVRAPEIWAMRVSSGMLVLQRAARPFLVLTQTGTDFLLGLVASSVPPQSTALSDAEYQELLETAYQQGALAAKEKEIILQIISLDTRQAREVMKSRSQIVFISDQLSTEEMIDAARKYKHRRLPIHDEETDSIVGILNTRALLLNPEEDLSLAIEFPSFVPETTNLLQLLKSMQRQQRGLAIVLDEFGGTAGIITLEDILAEILGEMRKSNVSQPTVLEKVGADRWRVSGALRVDSFRREYSQIKDVPGIETMAGLVLNELEVIPVKGQSVTIDGLRMTVQIADERRIRELLVETVRKR